MVQDSTFEFENDVLKTFVKEDIAVMRIKGHVFDTITDLAESGKFLTLFSVAERVPHIKALLITNSPGCFGEEEFDNFVNRITPPESGESSSGNHAVFERMDRTREINILNRVITQMVEFKKISVMGLRGNVTTPFFGSCLAMDFRIASEDMYFSLPHIKHCLHPGGALPFFLQRYVGHGRAVEILFKGEPIPAQKALKLGLINTILPDDDFENNCIREIKSLCNLDCRVINTTKLLVNFSRSELRYYFDLESALLH